jgi:nuclear GTP-binding protein
MINISNEFKEKMTVGVFGYPKVGKKSILQSLGIRTSNTSSWKFYSMMKRKIYICSHAASVRPSSSTPADAVLYGLVKIDSLSDAVDYIPSVLDRVSKQCINKIYKIDNWTDHIHFLTQYANRVSKVRSVCSLESMDE